MLKAALPLNRRSFTQCTAVSDVGHECEELLSREVIQNRLEEYTCSKDLKLGRHLHRSIVSNGLDTASDLGDYLIRMFSSCGSLPEADLIFCKIAKPSLYSWHSIMSAHALLGDGLTTINLFHSLEQQGLKPCKFIFLSLLTALRKLKCLPEGRLVHSQILSDGLDSDVVIGSTLIDMYTKCGSLDEARKVFDVLPNLNVVSWNAMIAGFVQQQDDTTAFEFFSKMQKSGIQPTKFTFSCVLNACINVDQGMQIHDQVMLSMLESDVVVGTALMNMYAKCGCVAEAHKAFDRLIHPDLASWNAIIAGYSQRGYGSSALELFRKMIKQNIEGDLITFSSVINACASIGAIEVGRLVYNEIVAKRLELDVVVGNSLIDMYAKSGYLQEAHKILTTLSSRDLVSWNTLIAVYAQHGNCRLVQQCLWDMIKEGTKPDERTFLSILAACSHAGSVESGRKYFVSMVEDFGVTHSADHFNCMIDLLGRSGHLKDAKLFLGSVPELPSSFTGWTSLLAASDKYRNMEVGRQSFGRLSVLDPVCGSGYVLMSNIFAGAKVDQRSFETAKASERCWCFESGRESL
ncbi:hypothetical protein GOP47_0003483 [Adiantum capillus-veneris]|uniref:Pentatricopeptide repeat-containing protein n=1 Tax=Adiantum capillus-veneris TaxID=13818 RepID=A0A9D4ZSK6_ADICA|nr:hypothetical protein GOP47_0003483 [Adiantum capillus-veneris]